MKAKVVVNDTLKTVSAKEFTLCLLASKLTQIEVTDTLIARSSYEDKIRILPHQTKTALHVLNNFSHKALLADEVGLGKTIEAGIIIKEYLARKLARKILILTPATLKFQWQEEMRSKFSEEFVIADSPEFYEENELVIASLDTAKTKAHMDVLKTVHWDLIIVDEAHKLKNSDTLSYKLVKSLQKERMLMLTATPLQNNIFELWTLVDLLHPGFLRTKAKFEEEFVADKEGLKIKDKEELKDKLSKIMVRTLRKETGIKFVDRKVETHFLSYSPKEMEFYQAALSFIKRQYEEIKKIEEEAEQTDDEESQTQIDEKELKSMASKYRQRGLLTFSLIMLTRQITSSIKTGCHALTNYKEGLDDESKIKEVEGIIQLGNAITEDKKRDFLLKLLKQANGEKVIVFTSFLETQKNLELDLIMQGYNCVSFNGTMTPQEKEQAISKFKEDKQILICTDAGSEGRNLQFAHILVNLDLPWNPMRVEQRIGRVHRIGQEKDVEIYNLAIKDTVEAYILNRLYEKINLFTLSVGEMDLILSELKGNVEKNIFDAYINDDDSYFNEIEKARTRSETIKQFDTEIFDTP